MKAFCLPGKWTTLRKLGFFLGKCFSSASELIQPQSDGLECVNLIAEEKKKKGVPTSKYCYDLDVFMLMPIAVYSIFL